MSPRETFRANKGLTRGYNDLIDSAQMQAALDTATREYDYTMQPGVDVTTAAANHWRKQGADAFRRILENLNVSVAAPTPKTSYGLDQKV